MSKKAVWHTTIGLAGIVYIVIALSQNVQSPVLAAIFILVAGYEVIDSRTHKHKP
jgi:hypothetical protein